MDRQSLSQKYGEYLKEKQKRKSLSYGLNENFMEKRPLKGGWPNYEHNLTAEQLKEEHPIINKAAEYLTKHPKAASFVEAFNENVGPFAEAARGAVLGGVQGLGNLGISALNLPLEMIGEASGEKFRIPHLDLSKYTEEAPIAHSVGNVTSQLLPLGRGINAAREIARPGGFMGILSDILRGAGAGYVFGETPEGERGLAAGLGGLLGGFGGSTSGAIANRVNQNMRGQQNLYRNLYRDIFNEAEQAGIGQVRPPRINYESIFDNSSNRFNQSLRDFQNLPSIENAHRAQSDMGKFVSHLQKLERNNPLTSEQHRALTNAMDAQDRLRGAMYTNFLRHDRPDLAARYGETTQGYARDVIPYTRNKKIRDYTSGSLSAPDLIEALSKNHEFMTRFRNQYPEIGLNRFATNFLPSSLRAGGAGAAAALTNKALEKMMGH